jgi:hypothetical protein
MFVVMRTPKKLLNIAKIDVDKEEFSFVKDSEGSADNHIDFNIFKAGTNRMIVLAIKDSSYTLQLRTISDLSVVHEIPLSLNFTILQIKLVGSIEWGLIFAVSAQYLNDYYSDVDSIMFQFSVRDDKIVFSRI